MDGAGFQGMTRFPLTPAEEALVPRPHSSASQVATALPSAYARRGSTTLASSPPQQRPQYNRKHQQNHPYATSQGSKIFSFSFSSSSITTRAQQPSSPRSSSPSSPSTPSNNHNSSTNFNLNEPEEKEYPQNPQDSYHSQLYSPTPIRPSSPGQVPRRSFSLAPRPARPPSPQFYSDLYDNTPFQRQYSLPFALGRGSLDSQSRQGSSSQLPQAQQESWGSSVRMESPEPLSDSEGTHSDNEETHYDKMTRHSGTKGILRRIGRSATTSTVAQEGIAAITPGDRSHNRPSADSEFAIRRSHDSQSEVVAKQNRSRSSLHDMSDEERQEPRRSRPTWRPSLSLIRQESSSFNVLVLQDHKRYPQNDQRRISDTPERKESQGSKVKGGARRKKKTGKGRGRQRPSESRSRPSGEDVALPCLADVLEKRTRYPLSYDDFEAFLRYHRAVEYLNFWADVAAHEQLCRTFAISERRLKREHQLEERAQARDRRNAYNRHLEKSQQSLEETTFEQEQDQVHDSGLMDAQAIPRFSGRRPSTTVEYFGNGIRQSTSQQFTATARLGQSSQDEIAELVGAVEELIAPGLSDIYNDTSPTLQMSQQSLRIVEPVLNRKPSAIRPDGSVGPLQPALAIRRSGEGAFPSSVYSTIQDGRSLLAQSYRMISLEDVEESALRIYRKYLIQLRTSSMAAEEETAAQEAALLSKGATGDASIDDGRRSIEKAFAPGWEGYAGQVIADWNEKWKDRSAESRRSRRMSERRGGQFRGVGKGDTQEGREKVATQLSQTDADHDAVASVSGEKVDLNPDDDSVGVQSAAPDGNIGAATRPKRPKLDRTATATGITAFLSRLLRTETTIVELPTLTINTTTVVTDADETDDSEYDTDDEYDSEYMGEDDEQETIEGNSFQLKPPSMSYLQSTGPPSLDNIAEGSLIGDAAFSETGVNGSAIQLQRLIMTNPTAESSKVDMSSQHQHSREPTTSSDLASKTQLSTPALPETISLPLHPARGLSAVAQSAAAASFYLPLECRQRIHTQVQQAIRTEGTHVFGPAKGFVVDVVLQDHYYPLFLAHVKKQNLGLLHRNHVNNRIKQYGIMIVGIILWTMVIAIQIMLVMMAWGGWSSPWVWVVGILGGWPGALCLTTGTTGFSSTLGIVGKIGEDRHVFRFRNTIESSIRTRHRRRAVWTLFGCLFWSSAAAAIFAAIPQHQT